MTLLYLRYRARMAWTLLKPGHRKDWGQRIFICLMVLLYLPVLVMVYWGLGVLAAQVAQSFGIPVLQRLLYLPAAGFGFVLLFLALNRVYPVLFESADNELLHALPIPARRLAHARLVGLALLLSPLLLLFAPLAVIFGLQAGAAAPFYAVGLLLLALFGLAVVGLGALVTTLLALAMSWPALRRLSRYGTALFLIPSAVSFFALIPMATRAVNAMDQLLALADRLAVGPTAWLVDGLAGAAAGSGSGAIVPALALAATAVLSWGGSLGVWPRLAARDAVGPAPMRVGTAGGLGWWAPGWLSSASRALWRRELAAVRAEAPRSLLMPAAAILFFAVVNRFMAGAFPMRFLLGIMAMSLVVGQTMNAVGQEGQAFWILRALPLPMWRVLATKLAVRTAVALLALALLAGLIVALSVVGAADGTTDLATLPALPFPIAEGAIPWVVLMAAVGLVLSAMWGLAIGARFPRFTPSRQGQYVGVGASLCGTFGAIAILASLLLSSVPLQIEALLPILWFLPLAVAAFWAAACLMLLAWAAWHLERLEP